MSPPALEVTGSPGAVWRVGFAPDIWAWTGWEYATDSGLFNGRWDDQEGEFRTLYTADSLLGCLLELLARFRPSETVNAALDGIVDDDGTAASYPDVPAGTIGHRWLEGRVYGAAEQTGRYCFITHSQSLAALQARYPFNRHGVALADVDAALLKDAHDRVLTRSIARWVYDLRAEEGPVDGIEFRSRHGDEIRMWAVFERSTDDEHPQCITPARAPAPMVEDLPELVEVFRRHGLSWAD